MIKKTTKAKNVHFKEIWKYRNKLTTKYQYLETGKQEKKEMRKI